MIGHCGFGGPSSEHLPGDFAAEQDFAPEVPGKSNHVGWMAPRKSLEVLPMMDSMVNVTSRALRSDADDGRDRERDRRQLCGVTQTTGRIANVIVASSAE